VFLIGRSANEGYVFAILMEFQRRVKSDASFQSELDIERSNCGSF